MNVIELNLNDLICLDISKSELDEKGGNEGNKKTIEGGQEKITLAIEW